MSLITIVKAINNNYIKDTGNTFSGAEGPKKKKNNMLFRKSQRKFWNILQHE